MGTRINPSRAYGKAEYKGKTYYFCCAMCPGEFKKNPDKYVK
ncbi:MAG: YHS domain-containing protein [Candidatus Margulisbacteria bacterium]|nr:YHS domain-containing protein [Candidatus Margulisiibacteriota bacterium]